MSRIEEALNRASRTAGTTSSPKRHTSAELPVENYTEEAPQREWPRETGRIAVDQDRGQLPRPLPQRLHETGQPPSELGARLVSSTGDFVGVEQYRRLAVLHPFAGLVV